MLPAFISYLKEQNLWHQKPHLLVAASGGMDSSVLCELCAEAGVHFTILHCNFSLRDRESDRDQEFVEGLGKRYGVPVLVKNFDTNAFALEQKISIQEAARILRYQWFEETRQVQNAAATLLAHHANDAIETMLMHFFRGTGLEGLTGIPNKVEAYHCLRPLLSFTRAQIEAFAQERRLQWVQDSSNESSKYTRNFFRNEVLPLIQKKYPQAEQNLMANLRRFHQTNLLHQEMLADLKKKITTQKSDELRIPVKQLLAYAETSFPYELIKDYGFGEKQVPDLIKLCNATSGKYIQNEAFQIIRHRHWLIITTRHEKGATIAIEKGEKEVRFSGGVLELKEINRAKISIDTESHLAQLDAAQIEFPLLLRPWKEGDYFYPLGMRKKKKLARFFIDQKLSKPQKEKIWIIESAQRIVWILGYRIDDRFKITEKTAQVLQLTWTATEDAAAL